MATDSEDALARAGPRPSTAATGWMGASGTRWYKPDPNEVNWIGEGILALDC